jgi:hypothetical protein
MATEQPKPEQRPRHIFAWDPGETNTGFVYFKWNPETKLAETKIMKILNPKELDDWLKVVWGLASAPELDTTFVIENFRIDNARNQFFQWSEVKTIRVIGKIEMMADWTGSKKKYQESGILAQGRKWAPAILKVPKNPKTHIPDDKSAWIHGVKYMLDLQLIRTVDDVILFGQERL